MKTRNLIPILLVGIIVFSAFKPVNCFGRANQSVTCLSENMVAAMQPGSIEPALTSESAEINLQVPPVFSVAHADAECGLSNGQLWISSVDASTGSGSLSTWQWHYTTDPNWLSGVSPLYAITTKVTTLPAGSYYVEVIDGAGTTTRKTVPEVISDIPSNMVFNTDHADAECGLPNGQLWISSVDASKGHGSISTWRWHYTADPTWQTGVSPWIALTTKVTNVPPGVYYIEMEDGIGCRKVATETETVGDIIVELSPSVNLTQPACTINTGSITVLSPVGAEYSYSIVGVAYQASPVFNGLSPGSYAVTFKNGQGCISKPTAAVINERPVQPECELNWMYKEYLNPICGEHEINTLIVSFKGGTGKYNFNFTFSNTEWFIVGGNSGEISAAGDHQFLFHAEGSRGSTIWLTITDAEIPDCITNCEYVIEHCKAEGFCTYSQGFYGNQGGMACKPEGEKSGAYDIMVNALQTSPVLFGLPTNGWNLSREDVTTGNIFKMLPGGGTPGPFGIVHNIMVGSYSNQLSWPKVPLSKAKPTFGSIGNTLFSQAVALFFNMDLAGADFKNLEINEKYLVTVGIYDCGSDLAVLGTSQYREIPQAVIDFLKNPANGYTADVKGLFALANDLLGGGTEDIHYEVVEHGKKSSVSWKISPEDVTSALGAFNTGFENCRILIGQFDELPGFMAATKKARITTVGNQIQKIKVRDNEFAGLKVYPNPFSENLRFEFVSPESVNASIELYDMTGRLVKRIFEQPVVGGVSYQAEFRPEAIVNGMYLYRVKMGEAIYNGKVVFKK